MEHQICRMILRDRCSASYDLASIFRGRRNALDRWRKIRKTHWYEAVSAAQLSIFEGSLAELLCFLCCQIQKSKKSRRIASFWMLLSSKNKEISCQMALISLQLVVGNVPEKGNANQDGIRIIEIMDSESKIDVAK